MKKSLSIIMAVFILISGMNLSVAAHFCDGALSGTQWSFNGKTADCGMCSTHGQGINSDCCKDFVAKYRVDKTFTTTYCFQTCKQLKNTVLWFTPISLNAQSVNLAICHSSSHRFNQTGTLPANAVSLPEICVFRI